MRRSDTKQQCDTSVPAVLAYMRCPAARWNVSTPQKLVLFTDETDPVYLAKLQQALAALPRWGGGVVHGDAEVARELSPEERADNYLVYAVASLLMSDAEELYAMERCKATVQCGPVHRRSTETGRR